MQVPQPPWSQLGKQLESLTRKALYEFEMVPSPARIAVALSGGKDSLTLLFLLKAISGRGFAPFELCAIHVGGEFTCGAGVQLDYLQAVCDALEVPLLIRTSTQKLETLECYSCSRERRTLLFEAAKSIHTHTIAFGHHRDDNAQTLLMNLLHKGEFAGNLPKVTMHAYGVTIIRPLIFVAEEQIRTFSKQQGYARILCRCPVGQNSLRKHTEELIAQMEELYPNVRANLSHASLLYGSRKAEKA